MRFLICRGVFWEGNCSRFVSLRNEIQKVFVKPGFYIVRSPSDNGGLSRDCGFNPK
jgi:hypothetical protein